MLAYRWYELRYNKNFLSVNFKNKSDTYLISIFYKFLDAFFKKQKSFFSFISAIPNYVNEILHIIWRNFSEKIDRYFEKLRSHRKDGKKGKVSIYWQKIRKDDSDDVSLNSPDNHDGPNDLNGGPKQD